MMCDVAYDFTQIVALADFTDGAKYIGCGGERLNKEKSMCVYVCDVYVCV